MDSLNPVYNLAKVAGSTAGVQHKEGHGKGPKPADFGETMRKALGTPLYLYDNNDTLLFIFDGKLMASKYLDINRGTVTRLLTPNTTSNPLAFGYISMVAIANNQKPTMTLEQVTELVLRDRLINPSPRHKGKKRTEAQNLAKSKQLGTPLNVYDVDMKLIASYHSQVAASKALGIARKTITKFVESKKLFRDKYYFQLGQKDTPNK